MTDNRRRLSRLALALVLAGSGSAAGLFCWQWADPATPLDQDRLQAGEQPAFAARADLAPGLAWPGSTVRGAAPSALRRLAGGRPADPIAAGTIGMRTVREDPFLEALASGINDGPLVLSDRSRGIPTFSTRIAVRRAASISDRAILGEIRNGVGGSLTSFLNNIFGTSEAGTDAKGSDPAKKNPFTDPVESKPKTVASEPADTKPGVPAADTPKAAPEPAPDARPTGPAPTTPADLVTTVRPDLMLHVDENGILHAMPAARLNEHTFETVELGIRQFNTLNFTNPAEVPAALAVADFSGDGVPDVCFVDSRVGLLRFVYGNADGTYAEGMRIEIGQGPRSLAAADYDGNGRADVAISSVGVGALTYILLGASDTPTFRSFWVDRFRDYIAAADTTGSGIADLIGLSFANVAEVLDSGKSKGLLPGRFDYTPALEYRIPTFNGRQVQLNAVMMGSGLSLNLQNSMNRLTNVLHVQKNADVYIIVGDLNYDNSISISLATPKRK